MLQIRQPLLQPERIKLIDGECTDATLRASGFAGNPIPASAGDVGERGIYDLDELPITRGGKAGWHMSRITESNCRQPPLRAGEEGIVNWWGEARRCVSSTRAQADWAWGGRFCPRIRNRSSQRFT